MREIYALGFMNVCGHGRGTGGFSTKMKISNGNIKNQMFTDIEVSQPLFATLFKETRFLSDDIKEKAKFFVPRCYEVLRTFGRFSTLTPQTVTYVSNKESQSLNSPEDEREFLAALAVHVMALLQKQEFLEIMSRKSAFSPPSSLSPPPGFPLKDVPRATDVPPENITLTILHPNEAERAESLGSVPEKPLDEVMSQGTVSTSESSGDEDPDVFKGSRAGDNHRADSGKGGGKADLLKGLLRILKPDRGEGSGESKGMEGSPSYSNVLKINLPETHDDVVETKRVLKHPPSSKEDTYNFPYVNRSTGFVDPALVDSKTPRPGCTVFFSTEGVTEDQVSEYLFRNFPVNEYYTSFKPLDDSNDFRVRITFNGIPDPLALETFVDSKLKTRDHVDIFTTFNHDSFMENIDVLKKTKYHISSKQINDRLLSFRFSRPVEKPFVLPTKAELKKMFKANSPGRVPVAILQNIPQATFSTFKDNTFLGYRFILTKNQPTDPTMKSIMVFSGDRTREGSNDF